MKGSPKNQAGGRLFAELRLYKDELWHNRLASRKSWRLTPTNDRRRITAPGAGQPGFLSGGYPNEAVESIRAGRGKCPGSFHPATPLCTFPFHEAQSKILMMLRRVFCFSLAGHSPVSCAHASATLNMQLTDPLSMTVAVMRSQTAIEPGTTNPVALLPRFPSAQDILHLSPS